MLKRLLQSSVNHVPFALRRRVRHVPGLAALQRWLLANSGLDAPFVHLINAGPAGGTRFEISLPADKAIWSGTYEFEFAAAIAAYVPSGGICYDIGGFRGYMAAVMAARGARRVVVFEPMPANVSALERLRQLNPELPIEVLAAAVGDADGRTTFAVMPDASMGKLASSSFQADARPLEEITVEIMRLDSWIASGRLPAPDLVKIDVEGAEFTVLAGAESMLRTYRPVVFMEIHSSRLEAQCTAMLSGLGYHCRRMEAEVAGEEHTRHMICRAR